jgi:hypothetical protein
MDVRIGFEIFQAPAKIQRFAFPLDVHLGNFESRIKGHELSHDLQILIAMQHPLGFVTPVASQNKFLLACLLLDMSRDVMLDGRKQRLHVFVSLPRAIMTTDSMRRD